MTTPVSDTRSVVKIAKAVARLTLGHAVDAVVLTLPRTEEPRVIHSPLPPNELVIENPTIDGLLGLLREEDRAALRSHAADPIWCEVVASRWCEVVAS